MSARQPLDIDAAFAFLRELREHNERGWFEAHRDIFVSTIKPQFEDFVAGLLIDAMRFDERFARVEPRQCIFRIYRDIRFAADKTPYKTYLSAFLSPFGWRGSTPGFYIALEPGGESVFAAGIYTPDKAALGDLRARFTAGDADFERMIRAKRLRPYLPIDCDPLARVPRGFPHGHPRDEFIRARRYMVRRAFADIELLDGDAFGLFRTAQRDTAPFVRWLDTSVTNSRAMSLPQVVRYGI